MPVRPAVQDAFITEVFMTDETPEVNDGVLDTAQVEEVAEEATASTDGEAEAQAEADDSPANPKPKGVQKRIDELTSNWRSAERERDRLLSLLEQQSTPKAIEPEAAQPEPAQTPPTLESVGYDEAAYQTKMAEWVNGNIEQQFSKREQAAIEATQKQAARAQFDTFAAKADAFAVEHPDYHDIATDPSLPISQPVADALMTSDRGPEVLYHLAKNPEEAARISSLPPHAAGLEIGRLEVKLSLPQPKKTTSAPTPIKPLAGTGSGVTDEDSLSTADWIALRNKKVHGV